MAQEALSPGQWEINWYRRWEHRPEFWTAGEWGKELAFNENGELELWLQNKTDLGSNAALGISLLCGPDNCFHPSEPRLSHRKNDITCILELNEEGGSACFLAHSRSSGHASCHSLLLLLATTCQALHSVFSMHCLEGVIFTLILKRRKLRCMQ